MNPELQKFLDSVISAAVQLKEMNECAQLTSDQQEELLITVRAMDNEIYAFLDSVEEGGVQ